LDPRASTLNTPTPEVPEELPMEMEQKGPDMLDSTVVVESVMEEIEPQKEMEKFPSSKPTDSAPAQVVNNQDCQQFSPSSASEVLAVESQQDPESLPSTEPTDSVPAQVENYQNGLQSSPSSASEVSAVESQQDPENLPPSAPADSVPVQVGSYQNRPQLFSPSSASDVSAVESDPDFSAHASISRSASGSGDPARIEEDLELITKFERLVLDKQQQQQQEINSVPSIAKEVPVNGENMDIAQEHMAEANETSVEPANQDELDDAIAGNPEASLESIIPQQSEEPITPKTSLESVESTVEAPERIEVLIEETVKVNSPESVQEPEPIKDFNGTSGAANQEKIEALNEINEKVSEDKPAENVNEPEVVDEHIHETQEIVNEEKTESKHEPKTVGTNIASDMNDESPAEKGSTETNEQTIPIKDEPINEKEANEEPVIPRKSYDLSFLDRLEDAEFATPPGLKPGKATKSPNLEKSPIEGKPAGKLLKY
jgi:hypothetical protein